MFSNNRIISLKPAVYNLSEVEIGLLSTYDRFKRDVLSREAQSTKRNRSKSFTNCGEKQCQTLTKTLFSSQIFSCSGNDLVTN